ncbi:hypothetical protein GTW40_27710 [Streptomyces sp. SID4985]|uniref:hypothetical protein n=1 Tax=Streptomyces sp. SID4985 TaxID=2690292 RepID=UPI0013719949|nr:hypothetical protein [Streptomyces sp. SID4985]MYQ48774.1 hypothetical protein [Streptomyces sp. SID4985]
MNSAPVQSSDEEFARGAGQLLASLRASFLHDEDLENDLDAILGATAGPMGVAGAGCQRARRKSLFRRHVRAAGEMPTPPDNAAVHELGCAVTRLDRTLGQLVGIAKSRLGTPPSLDVGLVILRANDVRSAQLCPVGEFKDDLAHLRRLAMAASDLLDLLSDEEDGW